MYSNRSIESVSMSFFMSNDGKEAINLLESEFFIVRKGSIDSIGWSKKVAREKLKELGKDKDFPTFMIDQ